MTRIHIKFLSPEKLAAVFDYDPVLVGQAQGIPERKWNRAEKRWEFKSTLNALEYVKVVFPQAKWDEQSESLYQTLRAQQAFREDVANGRVVLDDDLAAVPFKHPPFDHQRRALLLGRNQDVFAYLMEQGTGKTKVLLDDAAHNFRLGKIDALLVLCPNSVKTNWVSVDGEDQVSTHLAPDIPYAKGAWYSAPNAEQKSALSALFSLTSHKETLLILSVNIEAINLERIQEELLSKFIKHRKVMICVDESTRIKNRTALRTKAALKLRKHCRMARILSGTPLIKSPLDAFSQFGFLDPNILGYGSYMTFQANYSFMGGFKGKQVIGYKNLDDLSRKIAGASFRVTKDQCLDLPPKMYERRAITMSHRQKTHYERLRKDAITWLDNQHAVLAKDILSQLLRLQQVTSGFLPMIDPTTNLVHDLQRLDQTSPKVEEALSIIEETSGKVIVWCRFIAEIEMMSEALDAKGIPHCVFHGGVSEADRVVARRDFQGKEELRVFVGQVRTGGIGLDLYAATTVIYLSNTFSTEDRLQSEDRAHRIGQDKPVQYIDLACPGTVDGKIIATLRDNRRVSDEVMRDGYKDWI